MTQQQTDMFGTFDQQRLARRTDPPTSKQAAAVVSADLNKTQQHVVNVAKQRFSGKTFTANQIAQFCTLDGQKIVETYRKRVREIEAAGVFEKRGTGRCPVNGTNATLYQLRQSG